MATAATESQQVQAAPAGRKVVDEVSGWLRLMDDGSVDRTWTGPPEALPLMQPVAPYAVPRDGHTLHDLPGEPNLRVYLPEMVKGGARLPVIVQLHGGGFCISHPSWLMYHHFYARLACAVPAVVIAVELPLAPERRLPAHIDAGVAALRRLRAIALSEDGALDEPAAGLLREAADVSRVFLIGDSSGGNLVHLVGARVGQDGVGLWAPLRVSGGIPIHPGFVRATRSRSELETKANSVFFTLDMLDKFLALALPEGATKDHPFTCPMGTQASPLESVRIRLTINLHIAATSSASAPRRSAYVTKALAWERFCIDTRFHFIRECVEEGQVSMVSIGTSEQVADILTKALARERFCALRARLGMVELHKTHKA